MIDGRRLRQSNDVRADDRMSLEHAIAGRQKGRSRVPEPALQGEAARFVRIAAV